MPWPCSHPPPPPVLEGRPAVGASSRLGVTGKLSAGHRLSVDGVGLVPRGFWLELPLVSEYSPLQGVAGGGVSLGGASRLRGSVEKLPGARFHSL